MPGKRNIRINQGRFLPLWLRLLISAFLFYCIIYSNLYFEEEMAVFISIFLATPVLPIWNTYKIFEINHQAKAYLSGYWVAGFKFGKWRRYNEIVEIRALEPQVRNKLHPRYQKNYAAYLVFEDDHQVYLLGNNSRDILKKSLREIYDKLDLKDHN